MPGPGHARLRFPAKGVLLLLCLLTVFAARTATGGAQDGITTDQNRSRPTLVVLDVPFLDITAVASRAQGTALSLDEAVDRYALAPAEPREEQERGPAVQASLKLYAAGRLAAASGSFDDAVALLERAAAADPTGHLPLRALGQTLIEAGRPATGVATLRQAIDLGNREQRPLVRVGLDALRRGEPGYAARLLAFAADRSRADADATLGHLAWAGLGEALLALGHDRAAADALSRGLDLPTSFSSPATLVESLQRLYRKRGFLWVAAGDAYLRVGDAERAAAAYRRADRFPPHERPLLRPRRVYAELLRRQPERAAAITLERWPAFDGLEAALLSSIVDQGRLDPSVVRDAIELRAALLGVEPDQVTAARAVLAIASNEESMASLTELASAADARRHIAGHLTGRFRRLSHRGDPDEAIAEATRLADIDSAIAYAASRAIIEAGLATRLLGSNSHGAPTALQAWTSVRLGSAAWTADADRSEDPLIVAAMLSDRQQFDDLVRLSGQADRDDLRLLAAESLTIAGFIDGALELVDDINDDAPHATQIDALLTRIHARTGPAPDADRLAARVNEMRSLRPRSPTLRVLAAQELAGAGLLAEAERALRGVLLLDPDDTLAATLLLDVARSRIATDSPDAADDLAAWLDTQRAARPDAIDLSRLATGVHLARRQMDEAVRVAADARQHNGAPDIARLHENALIAAGRAEEAAKLRFQRLARPTKTIDEVVELAVDTTMLTELGLTPLDVLRDIPPASQLTRRQSERLGSAIVRRAAALQTLPGGQDTERAQQRGELLGMADWASGSGVELSPPMHERRLVLLAEAGAPAASMYAAAEDLARQHPTIVVAAYRRATGLLTAMSRDDEIVPVLTELAGLTEAGPRSNTNAGAELVRYVVISGTIDDAQWLLEVAEQADASEVLTDAAFGPGDADQRRGTAGLAYAMSGLAHAIDRGDLSDRLLLLTLQFNPQHAWAANDLGYRLLVRDGPSDEAERLIEQAATALPEEASILDSLGWLRYRQGILADPSDQAAGVLELGAVSLLAKAASLAGDRDPGTTRAHLGDALFASGESDAASDAWRAALKQAEAAAAELVGIQPPSRFARNVQALIQALQRRLAALDAGLDPLTIELPE